MEKFIPYEKFSKKKKAQDGPGQAANLGRADPRHSEASQQQSL